MPPAAGEGVSVIGAVDALAEVGPGDTSGSETFARYLYQCKVAVQRWLATLELDDDAFLLCEFADDVTTSASSGLCFAQVKTRDRGSWTAAKVLGEGGGIDALVRSYNLAKQGGIAASTRLELILEGPEGTATETRTFFADPSSASTDQKKKLKSLGLAAADAADFLGRLTIVTQYHARISIDAVTHRLLMKLIPGHTATIEDVYDKLLSRVIAAHLGSAASSDPEHPLAFQPRPGSDEQGVVEEHLLTRAELLTILPPIPALEAEQRRLLEAANGGASAMTDLEWKLSVAGAEPETITRAQTRRSTTAARLAERPTLDGDVDGELGRLEERALEYADAVTADVVGSAAGSAQAGRPAEVIYGRLVQQTGQLAALDRDSVLDGDGELVLGLVCELSDRCLFEWRST
jgi:hypothetical protein